MTALDQIANQHHLQIIKAFIPYLPVHQQKTISVMVKWLEIQNILNYYRYETQCIHACSTCNPNSSSDLISILSDIRNYCDDNDAEMIDQWLQTAAMLEMYSVLAQSSPEQSSEPE